LHQCAIGFSPYAAARFPPTGHFRRHLLAQLGAFQFGPFILLRQPDDFFLQFHQLMIQLKLITGLAARRNFPDASRHIRQPLNFNLLSDNFNNFL
jgi:hypothetical protein